MGVKTFSVILMVLFDDPYSDSEGLGPLSFIVMTLRILGGRVASTFEKRLHKFTAWMTYGADALQKRRLRELPDRGPPSELRGLQVARAFPVAKDPAPHDPRPRSHSATGSLRGLVSGCRL